MHKHKETYADAADFLLIINISLNLFKHITSTTEFHIWQRLTCWILVVNLHTQCDFFCWLPALRWFQMSSNVTVSAVKRKQYCCTLCLLLTCIMDCWKSVFKLVPGINQDFQMAVSINYHTELCDSSSTHMTIYHICWSGVDIKSIVKLI